MLSLVFGVASFAVATVLGAFMGGLALGSFLFGRKIARHRTPLLVYGFIEGLVALYALSVPAIFGTLQSLFLFLHHILGLGDRVVLTGMIRFVLAAATLLPPTCLMGGTLPVVIRWWNRPDEGCRGGDGVALLYSINTAGAVAGTLLAGFLLLPVLGVHGTIVSTAAVNLAVAAILIVLGAAEAKRREKRPVPAPAGEETDGTASGGRTAGAQEGRAVIAWAFACSGAVSLACEVVWTRVLVLIVGPSVYAFSLMLTAFLAGLAGGSALAGRFLRHEGDRVLLFGTLQLGIALASIGAMFLFSRFPWWFIRLHSLIGNTAPGEFFAAVPLILSTMLLPALAMGGTFPVAADLFRRRGEPLSKSVGTIYAFNTVGAIAGSFLGGFLLIPFAGIRMALLLLAGTNALLGIVFLLRAKRSNSRRAVALTATAVIVVLAGAKMISGAPLWDENTMTIGPFQRGMLNAAAGKKRLEPFVKGTDLLFYAEGLSSTITVRRRGNTLTLQTNGKTDASSGGDQRTQVLLGQLPMLLHPDPRDALVIGLASGISAGNVLSQGARSVTVAELEEKMIEASKFFRRWNENLLENRAVSVRITDARNYLLSTERRFDVIVSEPSNPWISGVNNLFTYEAFTLLRDRLRKDGILAQWFHCYGMATADLLALLNTYRSVFEHVEVFETQPGDLVLLGSRSPIRFDFDTIEARMDRPGNRAKMKALSLPGLYDLLALYLFPIEEEALPDTIRLAKLNTDDNMLLEFSAPKHLHSSEGEANRKLLFRLRQRQKIYRGIPHEHLRLAEGAVRAWDLDGARAELALEEEGADADSTGVGNVRARILLLRAAREGNSNLAALALGRLEEVLERDPTSATAHFLKGSALLQAGSPEEAETSFREARRLGEEPGVVNTYLGVTAEQLGRKRDALDYYTRALGADPANPVARAGMARLGAVAGETPDAGERR